MGTTQSPLFTNLTYSNEIKEQIITSGGTVVFMKNNVILASEISEEQYRSLLNNPFIEKMDVLPLKRWKNEGVKYVPNQEVQDFLNSVTSGQIINK